MESSEDQEWMQELVLDYSSRWPHEEADIHEQVEVDILAKECISRFYNEIKVLQWNEIAKKIFSHSIPRDACKSSIFKLQTEIKSTWLDTHLWNCLGCIYIVLTLDLLNDERVVVF